jgi:hypothetical protein
MFTKKIIKIAAVLLLLPTVQIFSQTPVQSIADLDRESAETAARIKQYPAGGKTIEVSAFVSSEMESPLGNYWRQSILGLLAGSGTFTVLAPNSTVRGDYVLSGEIIDLGQTVRIFTRIIDRNSSTVLGSWSSDLGKTPFLEGLLAAPDGSVYVARDSYEEDTRENPVEAIINGPAISRTLHREDTDWFAVRTEESALVVFETTGSVDTVMELYDERNRLAYDDDGGEGENARISYQLNAGTSYVVMVKAYSSRETGRYEFSARILELPDRALEPNNTRESASSIEPGRDIEAYLSPSDQDWYSFNLHGPARVSIATQGATDTILELYDAGSRRLAEDDDSGGGDNGRITQSLEGGTYFVQVKGYDRNTTGIYTLHFTARENTTGDIYESDDNPDQAKEIKPGEPQRRNFTDGDDEDWASFTVNTTRMYIIRARGEKNNNLDTMLELFDENGRPLADDDDGGDGYSSMLRRRLDPGRYYIRVSCLDDEPEDGYVLSVEREEPRSF